MEKIFQGRTEQEAVELAVQEFGVSPEVIDVEVIKRSKGNIFGLQGKVTIRASVSGFPSADDDEHEESVSETADYDDIAVDENEVDNDMVLSDEMKNAIEDFVGTITKALGIDVRGIDMDNGAYVEIDIEDEQDQNLLIGRFGKNVEALQILINAMLQNKIEDLDGWVIVDISGYRKKRTAWIRDMAKKKAEYVLQSGKSYLFDNFSPYDRRQIHQVIRSIEGIDTESEGYGYLKRVRVFLS